VLGGSASDAEEDEAGRNLVTKLTQHAFQVLNIDMDGFFDEHLDVFDQDIEELTSGQGETLEQYDAFTKYSRELERHFDDFAQREGFSSARDCFDRINEAVKKDALRQKEFMRRLHQQIQELQARWARERVGAEVKEAQEKPGDSEGKQDFQDKNAPHAPNRGTHLAEAKAEGKEADEGKSSPSDERGEDMKRGDAKSTGEEETASAVPVFMFSQPMGLESFIQTVLSIAEYTTFSHIMRMKVKQRRVIRQMEEEARDLEVAKLERRDHLHAGRFLQVFDDLVDRVCGLTPHRPDLVDENRRKMDREQFQEVVADGAVDGNSKKALQGMVDFVYARLAVLCAPTAVTRVKEDQKRIQDMVWGSALEDILVEFLGSAHRHVDVVKEQIYAFTKAQLEAARKAKEEAKHRLFAARANIGGAEEGKSHGDEETPQGAKLEGSGTSSPPRREEK